MKKTGAQYPLRIPGTRGRGGHLRHFGGYRHSPVRCLLGKAPDSSCPRAPRAGGGPRRRRLCPRHRQGRRLRRHIRPRRNQPRHRHRRRLHGLDSHGRHHRPGGTPLHRQGCLPGSATSRASPCPSPSTTTWSGMRKTSARIVKEAFHIAQTGRPGPVLIDMPKDVQTELAEFEYPDSVHLPGYRPVTEPDPAQIANVAAVAQPGGTSRHHRGTGGDHLQGIRGAERARRDHPGARCEHAAWPRLASPQHTPRPWACLACTVRRPPTLPCRTRTSFSRWAPASATGPPMRTGGLRTPGHRRPHRHRPRGDGQEHRPLRLGRR